MAAKRILFYSEGWGTGGIEAFVMNAMRALDGTGAVCDVFCTHDYDAGYDDEIARRGGKRTTVFSGEKPNLVRRLCASTKVWRDLLAAQRYDVVHINTMNGMGFVYAAIAQQVGVPVRIVHSHNTAFSEGHALAKGVAHGLGKRLWTDAATQLLACSTEAGRYLFDERDFEVVKNAIDIERFRFNEQARATVRERLEIPPETFVMGNVGRLSAQKDPLFLLEVFASLLKQQPNSYLLLIGQGDLEVEVMAKATELGLLTQLRHVRVTSDVASYLSAMDVFCMPSRYEGLPIAPVEAQANGLPVVCSAAISPELALTDLVRFMPPDAASEGWAQAIIASHIGDASMRVGYSDALMHSNYSLLTLKRTLMHCYGIESLDDARAGAQRESLPFI